MSLLAAAVAGLLLAAADHPLHVWWLLFVGFLPYWWGLARQRAAKKPTWLFGLVFAAVYSLAVAFTAGTSPPILIAMVAGLVQWTLATTLAARCLDAGGVRGALAAAAVPTLIEVASWHLVPVFGTAQALVRPLSAAPVVVAFVAYTGVGGLQFAITAVQALLVAAVRGPSRLPLAGTTLAIVASVATMDLVRWQRPLGPSRHVGAFGWGEATPSSPDGASFVQIAAQMAAGDQCRLLVTPEAAIHVGERDRALAFFRDLTAKHPIPLAIGVWHGPTRDNRIWFVDGKGDLRGEYRKTHLVPVFENYDTGDGAPVLVPFDDTTLGGMICQDDNFTDIARAYGRSGTPIVAVPTNDWPAIRDLHLDNAIFRAIENGYAVVRAASGGVSAIVSPRGEVVARIDHVDERLTGAGGEARLGISRSQRVPEGALLHADVCLGDGVATVYARLGDWPVLALCGALIVLCRRRPSMLPASR